MQDSRMPNEPSALSADADAGDWQDARHEILQQVIAHIPDRNDSIRHALLREFIVQYYHQVDLDDLLSMATEDLYGAALNHWELLQQKKPDEHRLHVYNPEIASHGWHSSHTVVEIVTADAPFLVSSLSMGIAGLSLDIHLTLHPVIQVKRDDKNQLTDLSPYLSRASSDFQAESVIHLEIDRITSEQRVAELRQRIRQILEVIHQINNDLPAMRELLTSARQELAQSGTDEFSRDEAIALLDWLDNKHFYLFGACALTTDAADRLIEPDGSDKSSTLAFNPLGLLAQSEQVRGWHIERMIPTHASQLFSNGFDVSISKAGVRSSIIRSENLDVVAIRLRPEQDGDPLRIICFAGLLTANIRSIDTAHIPVLRHKTAEIKSRSGLTLSSYSGRSLNMIVEQLPRIMLFQASTDKLLHMATSITNQHDRLRIRLFGTMAPGGRHCSALVYIPREQYGRDIRLKIESILLSEIGGTSSDFDSQFSSESPLARIHYQIHLQEPRIDEPDWSAIEKRLKQASITWDNQLLDTLLKQLDEDRANELYQEYGNAFPVSYKEDYSARVAYSDIRFIEEQMPPGTPVMSFYRNILAEAGTVNFKLFSPLVHIALSDVIPIIENMGLRVDAEHPFHVKRRTRNDVWIHEFTVQHIAGKDIETHMPGEHVQTAFEKIWTQQVENDGFNRLILDAGITWQQTVILRSFSKYLLQIRAPFSQAYMIDTLVSHATISKLLVTLFEQRFDPDYKGDRNTSMEVTHQLIREALADVSSLDQDRILRTYLNLILAIVRTNYYCQDDNGETLKYVSYKIDSSQVKDLPLPRPRFEIFVYSPRVEGIHLRGGKVARGGLRWSDRREDFRTEILGLMKAQMVKNTVIVPVGSKGGFYVKNPPAGGDREAQLAEGIACYQTFLRGLLDVTDNIVGETIEPPPRVVRHDEDDPYLVVAADKGTATFSDYANALSEEYGFWLGDAFASGGSVGYDHKKMGITARGAWESVKRHFRELGIDTQSTEFTAVGIGDMSGDVFGNGMLLSEHIRLVAAFNHMHIFIDPNPNAAQGFAERQRLFALPRSSWTDYDESLLSPGGAIIPRSAKSVQLSREACQALGLDHAEMTPDELISHILMAPVDLLWNGGIGTYIKSSDETHAEVSDRTNDAVRVNASDIRCRVIGEGGNLGLTQMGRIELAKRGCLVYTDAIDNSAGVDCSDHEVNIKILLNSIVNNGDMTGKQRDQLLADMTDTVAELVLHDNYQQTLCLNIIKAQSAELLEEHARFMTALESQNRLDRAIEHLPDSEDIADRLASDAGLTQPEIAVVVAYSKMALYDDLLESELLDDASLDQILRNYFPRRLTDNHWDTAQQHRLRREIIATELTNAMVNRLGPTFTNRMQEELGSSAGEVAAAFVAICDIFAMDTLWQRIEVLDNQVPADTQTSMHILVRGLVERSVHWLLRSRRTAESIADLVERYKPGVTELIGAMPDCLAKANRRTLDERCRYFVKAGSPEDTAFGVSAVVPLSSAMDIVEISHSRQRSVADTAAIYFELGAFLNLQWLRDEIARLNVRSHWHTLAKSELRSDIHYQQRHLCAEVLSVRAADESIEGLVRQWAESNSASISKYNTLITEMKASSTVDFAMLSLAVNEVHRLLRSDRPLAADQISNQLL